eukprot:TRINITY_DN21294_c0_g1_i1.p1 TRINITY_DN21294_c0_g1~~TRINITY_DN21294_c0_g1_i1.p1  ORF type:complete len:200 (-),score=16.91 TRINITY_DN21294_c0_g1_i1:13-612(-)
MSNRDGTSENSSPNETSIPLHSRKQKRSNEAILDSFSDRNSEHNKKSKLGLEVPDVKEADGIASSSSKVPQNLRDIFLKDWNALKPFTYDWHSSIQLEREESDSEDGNAHLPVAPWTPTPRQDSIERDFSSELPEMFRIPERVEKQPFVLPLVQPAAKPTLAELAAPARASLVSKEVTAPAAAPPQEINAAPIPAPAGR